MGSESARACVQALTKNRAGSPEQKEGFSTGMRMGRKGLSRGRVSRLSEEAPAPGMKDITDR